MSAGIVFGELSGSLCICFPLFDNVENLRFWTMKMDGDDHSWTEVLNFNVVGLHYRAYAGK